MMTTMTNFFSSLCAKNENDAKTTAADLTREATAVRGIRECNERYATIKPECRGVPRPQENRNSRQSSSRRKEEWEQKMLSRNSPDAARCNR